MRKLTLFLAALSLSSSAFAMTKPPVNPSNQPVAQAEYDALVAEHSRVLGLARDKAIYTPVLNEMAIQFNAAAYAKANNNNAAFQTAKTAHTAAKLQVCAAIPGGC